MKRRKPLFYRLNKETEKYREVEGSEFKPSHLNLWDPFFWDSLGNLPENEHSELESKIRATLAEYSDNPVMVAAEKGTETVEAYTRKIGQEMTGWKAIVPWLYGSKEHNRQSKPLSELVNNSGFLRVSPSYIFFGNMTGGIFTGMGILALAKAAAPYILGSSSPYIYSDLIGKVTCGLILFTAAVGAAINPDIGENYDQAQAIDMALKYVKKVT